MANNITNKDLQQNVFQEGGPHDAAPITYRPSRALLPISAITAATVPNTVAATKVKLSTSVSAPTDAVREMIFRGVWSSFKQYNANDVVLFNNSSYVCVQANLNSEPDLPPTATISVRQTASAGNSGGGQLGVVFANAVLAGSSIIVCIFAQNIGTAQNVVISDTLSSSYLLLLTSPAVNGAEYWNSVYIASNVGGAGTFSVNSVWPASDSGPGQKYIIIAEVTGLRLVQPDGSNSAGILGTFVTPPSVGVNCSNNSDLVFSAAENDNGSLATPAGFSSALAGGNFAGIAWEPAAFTGVNPVQWGGTGLRFTGVSLSLFPQVSTQNWALIGENAIFNIPSSAAQFNPYEVIFFRGSMYVCLKPTIQTPGTDPASWALWAQGVGGINNNPGNYTPVSGDDGRLLFYSSGSAQTLTLPNPPLYDGWWILIQNAGSGVLTVNRNGLNINGQGFNFTVNQNQGIMIFTDGANYFTSNGFGGTVTNLAGALTLNQVVLGNGGNDIKVQGSLGTVNQVLHGNAAGAPTWNPVVEDDQSLSDVTTDNVSTSLHGYAPKLPGDPTKFLNGLGQYVTPSGIVLSDASAQGTLITHTVTGVLRLPGNVIPPAGKYRISADFFLQLNPSAGSLQFSFTYNDGTATRTVSPAPIDTSALNSGETNYTLQTDGIHDITWTMTLV